MRERGRAKEGERARERERERIGERAREKDISEDDVRDVTYSVFNSRHNKYIKHRHIDKSTNFNNTKLLPKCRLKIFLESNKPFLIRE